MHPRRAGVLVVRQVLRDLLRIVAVAAREEGVVREQLAVHRNVRQQQRHPQRRRLRRREVETLEGRERDEGGGALVQPQQLVARHQAAVPNALAHLGRHRRHHPLHFRRTVAGDVEVVDQPGRLHALEEREDAGEVLVRVVVVGRDQIARAGRRDGGRGDSRRVHRVEDDAGTRAAAEVALEVALAAAADEDHVGRAARRAPEIPVEEEPLDAPEILRIGLVLQVVHDHHRVAMPPQQRERQVVVGEHREQLLAGDQRAQPVEVVEQRVEHEAADLQTLRQSEEAWMPFAHRHNAVVGRKPHVAQQHLRHVEHAAGCLVEAHGVVVEVGGHGCFFLSFLSSSFMRSAGGAAPRASSRGGCGSSESPR